jgi:RNA polymerase sigma-70 factor (ECF subfamily)
LVDTQGDELVSDRELLYRLVERRDVDAFTALVRRLDAMVQGAGLRVLRHQQDAEDVCQATFLLHAKKARDMNWRDFFAKWLYEVAYQQALKSRDATNRRGTKEGKILPKTAPVAIADITSRELQTILDEELTRLPRSTGFPWYSAAWKENRATRE